MESCALLMVKNKDETLMVLSFFEGFWRCTFALHFCNGKLYNKLYCYADIIILSGRKMSHLRRFCESGFFSTQIQQPQIPKDSSRRHFQQNEESRPIPRSLSRLSVITYGRAQSLLMPAFGHSLRPAPVIAYA